MMKRQATYEGESAADAAVLKTPFSPNGSCRGEHDGIILVLLCRVVQWLPDAVTKPAEQYDKA